MSDWPSAARLRDALRRYPIWYEQLPARDQRLLHLGQIVVPLLLLYLLVWDPLMSAHAALARTLPLERERAAQFAQQADAMERLRGRGPIAADTQRSPRALIEASAARAGLSGQLQQIEVLAGERMQVQLAPLEFDVLVGWLTTLASNEGWRTDTVQLKAAGDGRVKVERLVLVASGR